MQEAERRLHNCTAVDAVLMELTACCLVVALQGLWFSSLPPGLSNGTVLEVFDLWGNQIMGGTLPSEYSTWTNLGVFK